MLSLKKNCTQGKKKCLETARTSDWHDQKNLLLLQAFDTLRRTKEICKTNKKAKKRRKKVYTFFVLKNKISNTVI